MDRCLNHPERDAVALCALCGRPFCDECLAPPDDRGRRLCLDCAVNETAGEVASDRREAVETPVPPSGAARRRNWLILALLLLVAMEVGGYFALRSATGPAPALTATEADAADLGDLLMVLELVNERREATGSVPALLELAGDLPEDLAERVRAGEIRLEPAEPGFVLVMRTDRGSELAVNQDGEQVSVKGGGS